MVRLGFMFLIMFRKKTWDGLHQDVILLIIKLSCIMLKNAQTYSKTPQGFYSMSGDFSTSWIKGLGVSMFSIVFLMLFHEDVYHVKTQ